MANTIDVSGFIASARKAGARVRDIRLGVLRGVYLGALLIQGEARRTIMQDPKTGRVYGPARSVRAVLRGSTSKSHMRRTHRASSPGESPANDTGNLVRSIVVVRDPSESAPSATVKVGAKYGGFLEDGTEKMAPRPFMKPSVERLLDKVKFGIIAEVKKAIRQ